MHHTPSSKRGFTLIELSIVLVIIGLIVGGVLVGQDLIKAAEIRATVSQYEKYNAAMNTFLGKYNGLPGDIPGANATAFGLTTRSGFGASGDGNGLIQACTANCGASNATVNGDRGGHEARLFWNDLSDANLVDGNYVGADDAVVITAAAADTFFPPAKMGRGNYFIIGSHNGLNYYGITAFTGTNVVAVTTGTYAPAVGLTPIEAFNIDSKVDDGAPNTGTITALGTTGATMFTSNPGLWTSDTAPAAGDCTTTGANATDTANTYNRSQASGGEDPGCNLKLRTN